MDLSGLGEIVIANLVGGSFVAVAAVAVLRTQVAHIREEMKRNRMDREKQLEDIRTDRRLTAEIRNKAFSDIRENWVHKSQCVNCEKVSELHHKQIRENITHINVAVVEFGKTIGSMQSAIHELDMAIEKLKKE